jgi:hypothetical protein
VPFKYKLVPKKLSTAAKKAKVAEKKAKTAMKKADEKYHKVAKEVRKLSNEPKNESSTAKSKRLAKLSKAEKLKKSSKNNYERKKAAHTKAQKKFNKVNKQKKYVNKIADKLEAHDSDWNNEGKCAIYPTNATKDGEKIIYISPSDAESESNSSNVTSWPVDKRAPRSSYARVSSRGITVEGLLTGSNGDNAHDKYVTLRNWSDNHVELTYRGDIYYKHLIISGLNRDYTNLKDNLHVSITFTYVQAATISIKSKKGKKSSKASKTKEGKRTKKYTAMTIKPGDTLWALSKKYGKSVKWIAKVNNIKNINTISAGKKIRVR